MTEKFKVWVETNEPGKFSSLILYRTGKTPTGNVNVMEGTLTRQFKVKSDVYVVFLECKLNAMRTFSFVVTWFVFSRKK